jgi:hypothetical protein
MYLCAHSVQKSMVLRKLCEHLCWIKIILQSDVSIYENRVNIPLLGNKSVMYVSILPVPTGHKRSKSRRGRPGNMSTKGIACISSYDIPFQVSRESNILNIECFQMQWGILNKFAVILSLINRWNDQFYVQKFVSPGNSHPCPLQRMVDGLHSCFKQIAEEENSCSCLLCNHSVSAALLLQHSLLIMSTRKKKGTFLER